MALVDKTAWIHSVVDGRSFADIGGLWGTVNEQVSVAHAGGASHCAMIDIQPAGDALWQAFDARMAELGVRDYASIEADATLEGFEGRVGAYDVVHCSGVIYHLPDPFTLLLRLRGVTSEHLVLTSMHVPEIVENDAGRLDLSGGGAYLLHALEGAPRAVLTRHFEQLGLNIAGLTVPLQEPLVLPNGRAATSPWWWLMTPSLLRRMLQVAGFEVVDEGESWADRSYSFLCKARG